MKDIDQIDDYLNGNMGAEERQEFEARLQNEPPLKELFQSHKNTLGGLERGYLRKQMKAGLSLFWKSTIAVGVIILAATVSFLSIKSNKVKNEAIVTQKTMDDTTAEWTDSANISLIQAQGDSCFVIVERTPVLAVHSYLDTPIKLKNTQTIQDIEALPIAENFQPKMKFEGFHIYNNRDTILYTQTGTEIFFPANILEDINQVKPTGIVEIKYGQFNNYLNFWEHQISTQSDTQLLTSGGSCEIQAYASGVPLQVAKGMGYTISFPTQQKEPQMHTYYGQRDSSGTLGWIEEKPLLSPYQKKVSIDSIFQKTTYGFNAQLKDDIYVVQPNGTTLAGQLSGDTGIVNYFKKFDSLPLETKQYLFEKERELKFIYHFRDGDFTGFDYIVKAKNKDEKRMEKGIQKFARKQCLCNLNSENISKAQNGDLYVNLSPKMETQYTFDTIVKIDSSMGVKEKAALQKQNMNTIIVRKFGFVNCDFFNETFDRIPMKITVPQAGTSVQLFFKDFKASMLQISNGKELVFKNVPLGQKVLIIATMETAKGLKMSMVETEITDELILDSFVPFDFDEIKQVLEN